MIKSDSVNFKQEWTSSRSVEEAFDQIRRAFLDSKTSSVWPMQYSELKAPSGSLEKGTLVEAKYKTGPVNTKSSYTISEYESPRIIEYKTTKDHRLKGGAKITFEKLPSGKTLICWEGRYERKDLKGALAILWFKHYFQNIFFGEIKSKL